MPAPTHLDASANRDGNVHIPALDLGPGICADDVESRSHEWLLTNGRGGYACGSIAGTLDRRYHAFLTAAIEPPDTRTVVLAKLDERIVGLKGKHDVPLGSEVWSDGHLVGMGHRHIIRFRAIDGRTETTWLIGNTRITRRMVMPHGHDAIIVEYTLDSAPEPIEFATKLISGNRAADFLAPGADWTPEIQSNDDTCARWLLPHTPHGGIATPLVTRVTGGVLTPSATWYRGYRLDTEQRRGYDSLDDHLYLGEVRAQMIEGDVLRIEVSVAAAADIDFRERDPFTEEADRQMAMMSNSGLANQPPVVHTLVSAADQFVVSRPDPRSPEHSGTSIIAGYPWFADWGRDTMIALPGICLATKRHSIACDILETFSGYVDQGMIPNRFPGRGQPPEYNTADASLLYIEAIGRTWRTTRDNDFLRRLLPAIDEILEAYRDGTRHGICMDSHDGLITQGGKGLQLTWMDARIEDTVVTPRSGKAIEINALWHSAWAWRSEFAHALGEPHDAYDQHVRRIAASFKHFEDPNHPWLADVIDGPHGVDFSLRPNQLFATGCAHPPVTGDRAAQVLESCDTALRTPVGLRTLPEDDTRYQPYYQGDQAARDAAYHMGTSWPWLLGIFIRTHLRVRKDPSAARAILAPFGKELARRGLGTISEVHDGASPHAPGGCFAQAWSVGEVLAAWLETENTAPWTSSR